MLQPFPDTYDAFWQRFRCDVQSASMHTVDEYLRLFPGERAGLGRGPVRANGAGGGRIGSYELEREIGHGGQATVYLAHDTQLGRRVAIKILHLGGAWRRDLEARFWREARVLSELEHPNICTVYEAGEHEGRLFLVMQHIEGPTLAALLERRSARVEGPLDEPLELLEKLARALHVAHSVGVIHRDVKPGNVLVNREGDPVLLDFGLAHMVRDGAPTLTLSGEILGTPAYMAPEQIVGSETDQRTDVYSLGVVLYECLTGHRPHRAPTRVALLEAIRNAPPEDPGVSTRRLSRDVRTILATVLEKDPAHRYQSAADLAEDLRRARCQEPIAARPPSRVRRLLQWARRNPSTALSVLVTAAVLVVALVISQLLLASRNDALEETRAANDRYFLALPALSDSLLQEEPRFSLRPRDREGMREWLNRAQDVLALLAGVRERRLTPIESGASPDRSGAPGTDRGRSSLLQSLNTSLTQGVRLAATVARVEDRLALIGDLRSKTTDRYRREWAACIASVAADARFRGSSLSPIPGLVPLGRNAASGLWEFWHLPSGRRPPWTATGVRMQGDSGMVLVLLPGGSFLMGAQKTDPKGANFDPGAVAQDGPVHEVSLDPFLISKFEVTQAQWHRLTGGSPSSQRPLPAPASPYPVESVSWEQARDAALRWGLELPTEAQWEYAARAGTSTPWWTGRDAASLSGHVNMGDASKATLHKPPDDSRVQDGYIALCPAGGLPPNPFGLHETLGNVWEWCRDGSGSYHERQRPGDGLRSILGSRLRVSRGGSWWNLPLNCRSATRRKEEFMYVDFGLGFRPGLGLASEDTSRGGASK